MRLACPQPATVRASTPVKTSFIIMVRVGEDQGILTLEHLKDTLGVLPEQCKASLRSRAIASQGAHHSVMLRLFWLGLTSPPEHVKTAYKRL